MGVSVKVDYDNLPKDKQVEIPYLGLFKNGSTAEVDDARWQRFLSLQPGARAAYEGSSSVEFSTKEQQRLSEAQADLAEATSQDAEKSLEDYNKDELVDMAKAASIDTSGLSKKQLITAIEKSSSEPTTTESQEG